MSAVKDPAQQNNKTLVSLRNLNKHYGDFAAVDDIPGDPGRRIPDLPRLQRLGQEPRCRCWPALKPPAAARSR